jgi:hypothetical protein
MSPTRDRYTFDNEAEIPPGVSEVISLLLRNWDRTDDETHAYLHAFSADATLELPPNKVTGHDAIRAMRNSIIHPVNGPVTHVAHTFYRVYIMAGNEGKAEKMNISFTGSVDYTVRGGKVATQLFSTTFDLIAVGKDEYKVQFATIYTDNAPLMAGMAEMGPAAE